ncbi:hypothetical protein FD06_GL000193 [Apilactobacillus ozensis DSM 23829 = JCM 17196]|uniref:Alkaline shock protein n=1 Tax=Apilactobacillus ozensis DSM 23829 = JCM 17196 TaxID=1423781 RepID=A0A0R2AV86_9LACO|nr:Asp23/Gls24 family envelope stress response protein [Apilactobacillus ozensis]KRM68075.1 hypothetical protein FD06_GL000193 [Apilactobacillus ozensis DSM 23829 = JCM 17196]
MAEESNIDLKNTESSELGEIKIAPRVLEIVSSIASVQVKGVNRMCGSFSNSMNELFGHKEFNKGVKLDFNDDQLNVDVYVYLEYGVSVPQVALEIQKQVKQQLLFMTELKVNEVNVHVEGIVPQKDSVKIDPDQLFSDNENSKGDNSESN